MSDACPGTVALGLELEPDLKVEPEAIGGAEATREPAASRMTSLRSATR